jgi:group I intron endonuclease
MHYLYKITNIVNNKIYIGQTNNPSLRWSQHRSDAKYAKGVMVITRAITKYGSDKFEFELIASCKTQEDVDETETVAIRQYESRDPSIGYNIDEGGGSATRTPEVCQKISDGLNKFYETHSRWNGGIAWSQEVKDKISKSHISLPGTNNGKTFSDEWVIKISKSLAGKPNKLLRRFTDEIEKEICKLYVEEEKSTYALGKEFKCQRTTIADILRRNNIEIRNANKRSNNCNIFSLEQEIEICKLYQEGNITRKALSLKFKCGKTTVRDILLRHNIKL